MIENIHLFRNIRNAKDRHLQYNRDSGEVSISIFYYVNYARIRVFSDLYFPVPTIQKPVQCLAKMFFFHCILKHVNMTVKEHREFFYY